MEAMDEFRELFRFLAEQLPEMVAMFIGVVVCLAQSGRYPRPAVLGVIGFGLMLVSSASGALILFLSPEILPDVLGAGIFGESVLFGVRSLLMAVGCLLVLWALFSSRAPMMPRQPGLPPAPPDRPRG